MADIVALESEINRLDPSTFQRLCDFVMIHQGATSLSSLGNVVGKRKTRKGTPDSFYHDDLNDKYVFCEYTTEGKNIVKKFKTDFDKCIEEANKRCIAISKIVFIHTSHLKIEEDKSIRDICKKANIKLEIIGLTELVYLINKNKYILKEIFNIDENYCTVSLQDFINNRSNNVASDLSSQFIGREKEIVELISAIKNNQFVFITGESGLGKSRIAVEALSKTNGTILCVENYRARNADSILSEVNLDEPTIIFIDDINEFSFVKQIVDALRTNEFKNIKLVATVRNYALQGLLNLFNEKEYSLIRIERMSNDDIKLILKNNFQIINKKYVERIVDIADGNVRIAVLAAKECCENGLQALYNSESLLADYYKKRVAEKFGEKYKEYATVMFIIAFLKKFNVDDFEVHLDLVSLSKLSKEEFTKKCFEIKDLEAFKVVLNKVISFDDQCLNNYIIYDAIVGSKIIDLSSFLTSFFEKYPSQIVDMLNIILNVYTSEATLEYIKNSVLSIWHVFKGKGGKTYDEFVSRFSSLNEEESICYCKDKLFASGSFTKIESFIPFEKPYSKNKYISILESIHSKAAIHYLFDALEYTSIRNDALASIEDLLAVADDDFTKNFDRQFLILSFIEKTGGSLFYELIKLAANKILTFYFEYTRFKDKKTLEHLSFELDDRYSSVVPLRAKVWELSMALPDESKYLFILNYCHFCPTEKSVQIFNKDIIAVEKLLDSITFKDNIYELAIHYNLKHQFKHVKKEWTFFDKKYEKEIQFFDLVIPEKVTYEKDEEDAIKQKISNYLSGLSVESFDYYLDLLNNFKIKQKADTYHINEFIDLLIDCIDKDDYVLFGNHLLSRDVLVERFLLRKYVVRLIDLFGDDALALLKSMHFNRFEESIILYFENYKSNTELSENDKKLFNKEVEDAINRKPSCMFDASPSMLWRYLSNSDAIEMLEITFEKVKQEGIILPYLLEMLFNPFSDPHKDFIFNAFATENKLDLYFEMFYYKCQHIRGSFYDESEYIFVFALFDISYLTRISELIICDDGHYDSDAFSGLWSQNNCLSFATTIFETYVKKSKYRHLGAFQLKHLLDLGNIPVEKYDVFNSLMLDLYKKSLNDEDTLYLIETMVNETNEDIRIKFISSIIPSYISPTAFSKYHFFTSVESFSGSYAPVIDKKIRFLKRLKEIIDDNPDYIEYSRHITDCINSLINQRNNVLIREASDTSW